MKSSLDSLLCVCSAGEGRGLHNGPSVVAEHDRWTVYSSKVNLPAALNDPRLAKRESDFFTKTWGLDFTEMEVMPSFHLPNISREHFGPYSQEMTQVNTQLCSSELHFPLIGHLAAFTSDNSKYIFVATGKFKEIKALSYL